MEGNVLDPSKLSPEVEAIQQAVEAKIIGQDRAIKKFIKAYVPTRVKINRPNRPLGVFMFLGPTGVGKSELVKQIARVLLGKPDAFTRVDCTEFQHDHEVAKLLGSPPGYVGHDRPCRLAQDKIDQYQTKDQKVNIILFEEIEKADDRIFDALMSIIGDGILTLGNGTVTDFSRSFIFMTSNLGAKEVQKAIKGDKMGLQADAKPSTDDIDKLIYDMSKQAVEKKYRPEFINRLDAVIVFRPLKTEHLKRILNIEMKSLQYRIWSAPFRDYEVSSGGAMPDRFTMTFKLSSEAEAKILQEGTSELYGARELNRTIDRFVAYPLAALIDNKQIVHGDKIFIEYKEGDKHLTFRKDRSVS